MGKQVSGPQLGISFTLQIFFFVFVFFKSFSKTSECPDCLAACKPFFLYRQGSFISALVRELTSKNDFTHRVSYTVT